MSIVAIAGTAFTFYVPGLEDQANPGLFKSSPTIAAADFTISINGGAFAALTNTPTVSPAGGTQIAIVVSAAETTSAGAGGRITVNCQDSAGAEWFSLGIAIPVQAADISTLGGTAQTGDAYARLTGTVEPAIADVPTVAEFNARTLLAADYTIVSDLPSVPTAADNATAAAAAVLVTPANKLATGAGGAVNTVSVVASVTGVVKSVAVGYGTSVSEYVGVIKSSVTLVAGNDVTVGTTQPVVGYIFAVHASYFTPGVVGWTSRIVAQAGNVLTLADTPHAGVIANETPVMLIPDTTASGSGLTAQQTRDAMKLAPTAGAPAAGSVDKHLDDILEDTGATLPELIAAISQAVASTTDATAAGSITRRRGDSWSISLTVGAITGYTSLWFTARGDRDAADADSVLQVKKNASGLLDGLLYVNGAVAATAGLGSITVSDASTGAIIITVDEAVTDDLAPAEIYYDVQVLNGGNVTTLDLGTLTITADVTRAIL